MMVSAENTKEIRPLVLADNDGVTFADASYYFIEWRRLDDPAKVMRWVRHLIGKPWFSGEMCRELIDAAAARFGWDGRGHL